MEWIAEQLNTMGAAFVGLALPLLLVSTVLMGLVLLVESVLRTRVRASLRYWLVTSVLAFLVLTPLLSLNPPSTHWLAGWGPQSVFSRLWAPKAAYAEGLSVLTNRAEGSDPTFTTPASHTQAPPRDTPREGASNAPLSQPTTEQSQITSVGVGERPRFLSWQGAVFLLWLGGAAVMGGMLIGRAAAACQRIDRSPAANHLMNDILVYCRNRMGIRGAIGLKVGYVGMKPVVCGLLRPVIVVPRNLAPTLGSRHLRDVLFHELAHIKRYDLWVNFAQNVLQVLYFYNPVLLLVNRAIRRLREEAANETVLDAVGAGDEYAQRLAEVETITINQMPHDLHLIGVA
jgi:beta-lactamase regulating signal transducer with metallopeptidase domain